LRTHRTPFGAAWIGCSPCPNRSCRCGEPTKVFRCPSARRACLRPRRRSFGGQIERCLNNHHVFNLAVYQPASRFWLFQGIETTIFAGLAAVLLAAALWWLRHRID